MWAVIMLSLKQNKPLYKQQLKSREAFHESCKNKMFFLELNSNWLFMLVFFLF